MPFLAVAPGKIPLLVTTHVVSGPSPISMGDASFQHVHALKALSSAGRIGAEDILGLKRPRSSVTRKLLPLVLREGLKGINAAVTPELVTVLPRRSTDLEIVESQRSREHAAGTIRKAQHFGTASDGTLPQVYGARTGFRPLEDAPARLDRLFAELDRAENVLTHNDRLHSLATSEDTTFSAHEPAWRVREQQFRTDAGDLELARRLNAERTSKATKYLAGLYERLDRADNLFCGAQHVELGRNVLACAEPEHDGQNLMASSAVYGDDTAGIERIDEAISVAFGSAVRAARRAPNQHRTEYMMRFMIAALQGEAKGPLPPPSILAEGAHVSELLELQHTMLALLRQTRDGNNARVVEILLSIGPPLQPPRHRPPRLTMLAGVARTPILVRRFGSKLQERVRSTARLSFSSRDTGTPSALSLSSSVSADPSSSWQRSEDIPSSFLSRSATGSDLNVEKSAEAYHTTDLDDGTT